MCMEDIRIKRRTRYVEVTITGSTSFQQLLAPSPHRIAILFSSVQTALLVFTTNPNLVPSGGLLLTTSAVPFGITLDDYGELVKTGWFVKAGSGAPVITVWETLLAEE